MEKVFFTNPDLTWFDPAVGMGNFMVGVYLRLMKGLSIQPEEDRRKTYFGKHVIYE